MTRYKLLALVFAVAALCACKSPAVAGDLMDEMHIGFWRNNCWPKPFIYPDRKATFAPMVIMAENGWRRHSLIGAHHFTPEGDQLNESGRLLVRWVLTQSPANRRNVFVERAETIEQTNQRIGAVQQFASLIAPEGGFSVTDTHIIAEGRSAVDVDWSLVKFRENLPLPKLPERQGITALE